MGKNKLHKFAEMAQLPNVFQCSVAQMGESNPMIDESLNPSLQIPTDWRRDYFHNDNPIVLELGCGHGDYTLGLARRFPERNYIGIDIKGARQWHGAKQAFEEKMQNVAFLRTNIEFITRFFHQDEVDEIWITFPDPQMKKATKRLTSTYFMQRYEQIMKDGGTVHLKTDSPFLYQYTTAMLQENGLTPLVSTDDLYHDGEQEEYLTAIQTHYEQQWLLRGLTIKYIAWQLPHLQEWSEPEIEIEKDTYRSYGRGVL